MMRHLRQGKRTEGEKELEGELRVPGVKEGEVCLWILCAWLESFWPMDQI